MSKPERPIKLDFARKVFRLLFDAIDLGTVELPEHFMKRQRERGISLADLEQVVRHGHVSREHSPREGEPDYRWSLEHKGITLIFKVSVSSPTRIVFKTCWRGKKPESENI